MKFIDVPLCVVICIETSGIEVFAPKGTGPCKQQPHYRPRQALRVPAG
jgi:hypothetical protein